MNNDLPPPEMTDETMISEISIAPDGRVYVFGLSRGVLQILASLQPEDPKLLRLLKHVETVEPLDIPGRLEAT